MIDGTAVKLKDSVNFLGSMISWLKPTLTALHHRMSGANTSLDKLTRLWRGNLSRRARVRIFVANIVPVLLHGVALPYHGKQRFQQPRFLVLYSL